MEIADDVAELKLIGRHTAMTTLLEDEFFPTNSYHALRSRVFHVLEAREARLKAGLTEQKGAALIGPSGSGKSTIMAAAVHAFEVAAEGTEGREFGHRIISAIVPGRATVKETSKEILRQLGYPIEASRDDDYLFQRIVTLMRKQKIAGLHLDEVQDCGRHSTTESMKTFAKRFRNLMQNSDWPVCLFISATLEGREFINHDQTLTRRMRPIEIQPMNFATDRVLVRSSVDTLLRKAGMTDSGLLEVDEFVQILMHAAAHRFGTMIEVTIEAIGEALETGESAITLYHFAGAYYIRTNCDDNLNPFISHHWRGIDTTKALDRGDEEKAENPKRPRRKP